MEATLILQLSDGVQSVLDHQFESARIALCAQLLQSGDVDLGVSEVLDELQATRQIFSIPMNKHKHALSLPRFYTAFITIIERLHPARKPRAPLHQGSFRKSLDRRL